MAHKKRNHLARDLWVDPEFRPRRKEMLRKYEDQDWEIELEEYFYYGDEGDDCTTLPE